MVMCADILAIGPYNPEITQYLNYPPDYYRSTQPGTLVVAELFGIVEGSGASSKFASCLGIPDPWDFNQHNIDPGKIDVKRLYVLFHELSEGEEYLKQLNALVALRDHGFKFIFRPNG